MKTYARPIKTKYIMSTPLFYGKKEIAGTALVLRDEARDSAPHIRDEAAEHSIQRQYLRDIFVILIYKLVRFYEKPVVAPEESVKLRKLVDEIIEAKQRASGGKEEEDKFYPRSIV